MFTLCKFMSVCKKDCVPDGIVVENCGQFYPAALESFCIICREHELAHVETWIRENIGQNADHCIKMFHHSPENVLAFVRTVMKIKSYTDEFVADAGGIQGFLDRNAAGFNGDIPEVPNGGSLQEVQNPDANHVEQVFTEPEYVTGDSLIGDKAMGIYDEDNGAENNEANDDKANDGIKECVNEKVQETVSEAVKEAVREVMKEAVREADDIVIEDVHKIQQYNPKLIKKISDEDILESLRYLRDLDARISLDGLDPGMVLSDSQLKQAYNMLEAYPPAVMKDFVLNLITQVDSNTERIRVSSILDDFASYICEKQGGECN